MSPADLLLPRLDGVRRTGPGRWVAKCPAHADRVPSLTLREASDGRLLLHCFGGCPVDQVLEAVGLELHALFARRPGTPGAGTRRERRPWNAADLLALAAHEARIVFVAATDLAQGRPLPQAERQRLLEAARRLGDMVEACHAWG